MELKETELTGIWSTCTFYIFASLYFQLLELFVPISVTKLLMFLFLCFTGIGLLKGVNKIGVQSIVIIGLSGLYLLNYFANKTVFISCLYPLVIVLSVASLMIDNSSSITRQLNYNLVLRLIFIYVIFNILIYITRFETAFQDIGSDLQFRGALPHTNLLAGILLSLLVCLFWKEGNKFLLVKLFITLLVFLTMSRTYILLCVAVWLIRCTTVIAPRLNIWVKIFICVLFVGIVGIPLFSILISVVPSLKRFQNGIFSLSGREVLQEAYWKTITRNANWFERIFGVNLAQKYSDSINIQFNHSFTENSYAGVTMLMGIIGLVLLVGIIVRLLNKVKNIQTVGLILVMFLSLIVQDTLLATQAGVIFFYSIIVMVESAPEIDSNRNNVKSRMRWQKEIIE